jgi:formylglycine-generating enzyme required for sulfatase activity
MRGHFIIGWAAAFAIAGCGDDNGNGGGGGGGGGGESPADAASGADGSIDVSDAAPPREGTVRVPPGPFTMGCDDCGDDISPGTDERPAHEVTLSGFDIDVTEVTQGAYAECVAASACSVPSANYAPEETPTMPVRNVTWDQAVAFCEWGGKRLPTEAEWEKAARGTDGRLYPWGEGGAADCERANTDGCGGVVLPVGSIAAGASPYGALDMAGNLWEWTHDYYAADAYASHDGPDPQGPDSGTRRVYRGGSYGNLASQARASNRAESYNPDVGGSGLGFRCVAGL